MPRATFAPAQITNQQGANSDTNGQGVCLAGASSVFVCGTIVNNNETINFSGNVITNMREVTFASIPGDSGGSLYDPAAGGPNAQGLAMGIMSGARNDNGHGVYTQVTNDTSAMGVQVMLGCVGPPTYC